MSIFVISPPTTVAVPNAPEPPPPVILTDTRAYPDPAFSMLTVFTLYVTSNKAPCPNSLLLLVETFVSPGKAVYTPFVRTLKVSIAPGVDAVLNTSTRANDPAPPVPVISRISPGK